MASYIPNPGAPRTWQSEMQKPGPVRRAGISAVRSGSSRNYGSTWQPSVDFARAGSVLNNATGQYGNYLLYRDQVAMHNEHVKEVKGKELNKAAGTAIEAMLGGVSKNAARGAKPGPPSIGSPHTGSASGVGPSPIPHQQVGNQQQRVQRTTPLYTHNRPEAQSVAPQQLSLDFGRPPGQPTVAPGSTATPAGPQANDPRVRRAGMDPAKKGKYFDASGNPTDQDPWFLR